MFQAYNLIPVLSAVENVEYVMQLQGVPSGERREMAMAMLDDVGLSGLHDRRPAELSGGQQQRVAVARAIVSKPSIVLADEPTGNLDSSTSNRLHDLLFALNEKNGLTMLIATHNEELAGRCHRQMELCDGIIRE